MDSELELEIRQIIQDEISRQALSSLTVPYHTHTLTDAGQLDAKAALIRTPQAKLTAVAGGALTSGGAAVLSTADSVILANAIARLADLETKLTTIGLLKSV